VTVGVDLAEVPRLARLATQPAGLSGVLTERELEYCQSQRHPAEHLAARFAAKEAVLKALGTGLSEGIRWTDVEILKARGGRPLVTLHGSAESLADRRQLRRIDVSLSHTAQFAVAFAVAVWSTPPPG
jgi:holo-[acyl-carrier protein] synthase